MDERTQTSILAHEAQMTAKEAKSPESAPEPAPEAEVIDNDPEQEQGDVQVQASAEPQAEEHEESAPSGDDHGEDSAAHPKKSKGAIKRINELTREKYEGIRRAEAAEARLQALEQQFQQAQQVLPTQQVQGRPTLEQYGYDQEAFAEANETWLIGRAKSELFAEVQQAQSQRQYQEKLGTFEGRIQAFEAINPGAWKAVLESPVQHSQAMREAVADSDIGPRMAHYLTQHLDEAHAITQLSPNAAARAMGRLEAKLTAAPPPKSTVSKAPAPAKVIQSSAPVRVDPDTMGMEDHIAHVRALRKQKYGY